MRENHASRGAGRQYGQGLEKERGLPVYWTEFAPHLETEVARAGETAALLYP